MHVAIIINNFIFFANLIKRFMMLDPILLRHIKMRSKRFEEINKELRIKPKLSTKFIKTWSFNKGLNAIILINLPDSLPLSISQSSVLCWILSKSSHLASIFSFVKEPIEEASSKSLSCRDSLAYKLVIIISLGSPWLGHFSIKVFSLPQA